MSGSEILSNDPVSKKPRLEDQDKDQDMDHGEDQDKDQYTSDDSMSDDESVNRYSLSDYYKDFDFSTNIPPGLQWRERNCISETPPDSELGQIMSKITRLKATGFKGISFTAWNISDAFELLIIFSDPGGVKVSYEYKEDCVDPYGCLYYITLLKKLVDSGIVSDDDESARKKLIDILCERALKERSNRLKRSWTGLDYIKLKLDVANVVGIHEIPDEIVDFVLPEHHRWSSLKGAFEPVPCEFERMAKLL